MRLFVLETNFSQGRKGHYMSNKNRKPIREQNPILKNCLYILVPVAIFFLGVGANSIFDFLSKLNWFWPVLITAVVTSLFWAIFYGLKEQKNQEVYEEREEDEDESGGF